MDSWFTLMFSTPRRALVTVFALLVLYILCVTGVAQAIFVTIFNGIQPALAMAVFFGFWIFVFRTMFGGLVGGKRK